MREQLLMTQVDAIEITNGKGAAALGSRGKSLTGDLKRIFHAIQFTILNLKALRKCSVETNKSCGSPGRHPYFRARLQYESLVHAASQMANVKISAVISHSANSEGLVWARAQGIQTEQLVYDAAGGQTRVQYDQALAACIDRYQPDLVLLAGFMRILSDAFVQHYAGRLINIHPSLLPCFRDCILTSRHWMPGYVFMAAACILLFPSWTRAHHRSGGCSRHG